MIRFHDLAASHLRHAAAVEERMRRVLAHGRFILGPEVEELEQALADFVGVPHVVTVKSGTLALELSLRALGIRAGDEVITTPFSWISAAEAIALLGATPVFVDIDPTTFLLDASLLEAAITARTRAIIPVSLFGQMPELERMNALAERHGLAVIEDGAQSFGASRHGKRSCGVTTLGVTSFFPTKPLGCYGDGGAIFTADTALARRVRTLRDHGSQQRGEHTVVGINGRLDTLQAAILLAKLPTLDDELGARQRLADAYTRGLSGIVATPGVAPGNRHVFGQYTVRVAQRDKVERALFSRGVESAVHYRRPLYRQPVFEGCVLRAPTPNTEAAVSEVLSLPLHPALDEPAQDQVIRALQAAIAESGGV